MPMDSDFVALVKTLLFVCSYSTVTWFGIALAVMSFGVCLWTEA